MPDPALPSTCVVLVPVGGPIDPGCDDALRELERRGYPVWRYRGYSAVDATRNQVAPGWWASAITPGRLRRAGALSGLAIDAFLSVMCGCFEEPHRSSQVWVRRSDTRISA